MTTHTMILHILSTIGLITVTAVVYYVYNFVTLFFHTPSDPLRPYKRKEGQSWALISGSSGGMGYALAHRLLSLGFGVIIFAHEGVPEAEAKLRNEYPNGHIKAFTFNCMTASIADMEKFVGGIKDLPITILANNVGSIPQATPAMRPFAEFEHVGIDNIIDLNARFMTHLTLLMIPILRASASPRALILNTSSAGRTGMAYISVYSATKAYNAALSRSLTREFRLWNYPIDSLCIIPGDVKTDGNSKGVPAGQISAADFVNEIVSRVDEAVRRGMLEIAPYWKHSREFSLASLVMKSLTLFSYYSAGSTSRPAARERRGAGDGEDDQAKGGRVGKRRIARWLLSSPIL